MSVHELSDINPAKLHMTVPPTFRRSAKCNGEQFHGPDKLQEDLERQAILERLGWTFVRIRGSLFFRDEDRALQPVFRRLQELNVTPELVPHLSSTTQENADIVERIIRRAEELRHSWHPKQQGEAEFAGQA